MIDRSGFSIMDFNGREYLIQLCCFWGEVRYFRGFSTDVGGATFVNLQGIASSTDRKVAHPGLLATSAGGATASERPLSLLRAVSGDEAAHVFARVWLDGNGSLNVRMVHERLLLEADVASSEELYWLIASLADDDDLYDSPTIVFQRTGD